MCPRCILRATTVHYIETTNHVYIRPVAILSAAAGIISEQPRTYIYVQNCQLQESRENMPATKGFFEKVTQK